MANNPLSFRPNSVQLGKPWCDCVQRKADFYSSDMCSSLFLFSNNAVERIPDGSSFAQHRLGACFYLDSAKHLRFTANK
jgi:hypothetical protein